MLVIKTKTNTLSSPHFLLPLYIISSFFCFRFVVFVVKSSRLYPLPPFAPPPHHLNISAPNPGSWSRSEAPPLSLSPVPSVSLTLFTLDSMQGHTAGSEHAPVKENRCLTSTYSSLLSSNKHSPEPHL